MEILRSVLPNIFDIFYYAYVFVTQYYGWVFFVIGLIFMLWHEYLEEIQGQFVRRIDWVFLKIKVPKENTTSTLAVEGIFSQMHALHRSLTWEEKYAEGQFQMWYSLEIISLGGNVSFVMRVPRRYRHLVESSFYSKYPTAEIREVSDYMENFKLDPYNDENKYDFFGTELKTVEDSVIPIKTYKDFEHPSAEEKVIDPLTGVIETMERVQPHEFLGMQILIQPIQNDEWEQRAQSKIKQLTGEHVPHSLGFWGIILWPFTLLAKHRSELLSGGHEHVSENAPRNNWLSMTEGEKKRVTLIEEKLNKANYNTKIRLIYAAPKDKYDKIKRFELIGALRQFSPGGGAGVHNTIKTDHAIWTKVDPYFSPGLEKRALEYITKYRKYWFLRGYKNRSIYIGSPKFLLSVEEVATLYHFPITQEGTQVPASVQTVESKKVRAPANLPIGEQE